MKAALANGAASRSRRKIVGNGIAPRIARKLMEGIDMLLLIGCELSPQTQREVLSAYVYRLTTENGYPKKNPCGARVPAVSDVQWLREHAFWVTKSGRLARNRHHAEPAFMVRA